MLQYTVSISSNSMSGMPYNARLFPETTKNLQTSCLSLCIIARLHMSNCRTVVFLLPVSTLYSPTVLFWLLAFNFVIFADPMLLKPKEMIFTVSPCWFLFLACSVVFLASVKITLVDGYMHIYCHCMNLKSVYFHVCKVIYTVIVHCRTLYTWLLIGYANYMILDVLVMCVWYISVL